MVVKKVGIIQSNYIPWKGYFDFINYVDDFVFLDDVQYTRRDWRNRNMIKGPQGLQWLTIPVEVKGKYTQLIQETKISDNRWALVHWKTISTFYRKSSHFSDYRDILEYLYLDSPPQMLSDLNYRFIKEINKILGINTNILWSHEFKTSGDKTNRLVEICKQLRADIYLSGPAAKTYLDEKKFHDVGIQVDWIDYSGYSEYHQLYPPFEHRVSILDLILNEGKDAKYYLKSF